MNRSKKIENILKKHFTNYVINIEDTSHLHKGHNNFDGKGETHIMIILKKNTKNKVDRLNIHKKINYLLKEEFNNGLHALEIKIILSD